MGESAQPKFELYWDLLYLSAQLDLDIALQGKLDLSGIIQQTILDAYRGFSEFRGQSEVELIAWLRRILAHNLIDEIRRFSRARHDARLDVSIAESSLRLQSQLVANDTPPMERAAQNELLQRLSLALLRLPADQQLAVIRHHLQAATLSEVAAEMGRSREAIAGLIHRGICRLRQLLDEATSLEKTHHAPEKSSHNRS